MKRYLFNFFKAHDNVVRVDSWNFEQITWLYLVKLCDDVFAWRTILIFHY